MYLFPKLAMERCICGFIHWYSKQLNFGFKWEQLFSFSLEIEDALNFPYPLGESQNRSKTKIFDDIFLSAAVWLLSGSSGSQINTQLLYTGDGAQWISEGNSAWDKELKQLMKVQSPFTESIVYHMHVWLKRLGDFFWFHTSLPYFLRLVWVYPANTKQQRTL